MAESRPTSVREPLRGGLITLDLLESLADKGEVDTVLVVFPDLYGRFMGKRVPARFFLDQVAEGGMHACNYLLTVDMEMDVVPGYRFANWQQGYGDFHCRPDLSTLRRLSWLDRSAQVICDLEMDHRPVAVAPREILRRQVARLADAGYRAMAATELEYYLFRETYETAREKGFEKLETGGSYIEDYHMLQGTRGEAYHGALRRHLDASGIPVESSKGEWGPGQHELNIRYAEALEMADRHAIYKQAAKEIAMAQGVAVTFMAKWRSDLAGSSTHLHLSLWDADGREPLFPGEHPLPGLPAERSPRTSDELRWFLGGWMRHARALAPFYAPYPASYKRFVFQSWAPTTLAWTLDNRTSGFRLVGEGRSLRIECRIPGADANPYLAIAASLAAGLAGIRDRVEPPPAFAGDAYVAAELPRVPSSLREAVAEMEASEMLREAFGGDVIEHYAHFFRTEQDKFDRVVTSWERERYFERA